MFTKAWLHNQSNIINLVRENFKGTLLDLGCNDGSWTNALIKDSGSISKVYGIDIVLERLQEAKSLGIQVVSSDLNISIPILSNTINCIHANQVIEHVANVDTFLSEIHRVLRPGGHAVISTENSSSWCNIGALILGWQMFSLTNVSSKQGGVGNPLALHRGLIGYLSSWTHKTIFSFLGLVEFAQLHSFEVLAVRGAGYFPLPTRIAVLDPVHSHFITILLVKK
jgi:ubiquinone/menaquinone biosynthesis C-methylase UbiE